MKPRELKWLKCNENQYITEICVYDHLLIKYEIAVINIQETEIRLGVSGYENRTIMEFDKFKTVSKAKEYAQSHFNRLSKRIINELMAE